jgi:hypothetical protein
VPQVVSAILSAAKPTVAISATAIVTVHKAQATAAAMRRRSVHSVRAVVGRISARTSAETLRPESRVLASGVRPSVPPYQALIRIPNQATATASAASAAPPAARVT